jgi:hypothetical protein
MKTIDNRIALLLAPLLFIGGGCLAVKTADQVANDAVKPVAVPLAALDKAKEVTAEEKARSIEEAESITNEVGVVMILTDGETAKPGMDPGEIFGCNDRPVVVQISRESATGSTLHDALDTLFAVKELTVNDLHNSLADSTLSVDKILSSDGVTTEVYLKGELSSGGACDDPRITEQVEGTIRRFKPKYKVYLNGSDATWRCHGDMSGSCT